MADKILAMIKHMNKVKISMGTNDEICWLFYQHFDLINIIHIISFLKRLKAHPENCYSWLWNARKFRLINQAILPPTGLDPTVTKNDVVAAFCLGLTLRLPNRWHLL